MLDEVLGQPLELVQHSSSGQGRNPGPANPTAGPRFVRDLVEATTGIDPCTRFAVACGACVYLRQRTGFVLSRTAVGGSVRRRCYQPLLYQLRLPPQLALRIRPTEPGDWELQAIRVLPRRVRCRVRLGSGFAACILARNASALIAALVRCRHPLKSAGRSPFASSICFVSASIRRLSSMPRSGHLDSGRMGFASGSARSSAAMDVEPRVVAPAGTDHRRPSSGQAGPPLSGRTLPTL